MHCGLYLQMQRALMHFWFFAKTSRKFPGFRNGGFPKKKWQTLDVVNSEPHGEGIQTQSRSCH